MPRKLGLALLALASAMGLSWASGLTENGLSLLSYQLCSYQETRMVQRVEAVQTSHVTHVACGGWIPWRRCPKTVYRTQHLTVTVPEPRNVTACCKGYEQLGVYCVLPLNRSTEFASRPGICPTAVPEAPVSPCSLDADCPGIQKCCPWRGDHHCVDPAPQDAGESPWSWYNVTMRVKTDFEDLQQVDPKLRNHSHLLCSLVASALQPLDSAVHYLGSASGDTSTTVSGLLLGLARPLSVANVSAMLDDIMRRVCEVMGIWVQDVDECVYAGLQPCSRGQRCVNLEGSYQCLRGTQAPAPSAPLLGHAGEDCPPIRDHVALNVTSSSFWVSWSASPSPRRDFHVQVSRGEQLLRSAWTSVPALWVTGLEAGQLYTVRTSYQGCGANISTTLSVKTDARVFEVVIRITDRNLTEQLLDGSSEEHRDFSWQLLREVENSFPPALSDLHSRGKLRLEIASLRAGSLVVSLRVIVQDPESPVGVSTLAPMLQLLCASAVFQIDPQGTRVQDWDECAHSSEHDCSPAARCINLEGSYTCQCREARGASPGQAGWACEGDAVSPTGSALSAAMGVTAPAIGTGTTTLVPEPPTLSLSRRNPGGSPTPAQAWTSGPLPKRGAGGIVGEERNSTGPGSGPVKAPGQPWGNATTELPTSPASASGPPGHVEWHTSRPTRGTPLDSVGLRQEDPGPSPFRVSPSVLTPESPKTPACVPVPIRKATISNVTGTSFHLAWAADITPGLTFHLTALSPRSTAVGLDTREPSATLSGLEPGVLYLVEIAAKACGKEGARMQLKVRTAAQKLRGRVRIANIRYSESLGDASSEQSRHFLGLFSSRVRDSLPATLRQHVDSGGIRVSVTRVTNGSVVVEFDLLMTVALDVQEVSAAFLDSLGNMSGLEAVRSNTVIWDYDECGRKEDDCVPGTSCQNTLGSFTCSCERGAPDSHVEYSGRACVGGSADSPTATPGPEWPPAGARTPAALPPSTSPVPLGPPARLNLTGAARVLCEIERVAIAIQKRFLLQEAIPEASLYLGQPPCNVSFSNASHVLLTAGWAECGTLVQSNKTSTVVKTVLRNNRPLDGVIHHPTVLSPIRCVFQNDLLTSLGYTPKWGEHAFVDDLHGAGMFVTEMQLFVGDSPIPQNHSVSASEDVKIQVGLDGQKSGLKVVLMECWATPSRDAWDPVAFGFINNSCPIPNTHTSVIQNGDSSKAQFKLRIFSFVNNSLVYLHCKLRVCMESPGNTCKINCNDFRFLRSGEGSTVLQATWGPLFRLDDGACPRAKPQLGAGYVALITVSALAVVAGAVTLLILRNQRTTGNYNFSIQPGSLGYQVFSG
ncbi:Uromodulin-like 1 [Fukomys damarensis]|uniref:Uromodulin-like 1 n=1 Tax=Fukomys damarensis TaxID=885580 RepID=A0A091DCZ8_FUKDA|nr:Uromodulin-like 1 [Fukomys damarensis]